MEITWRSLILENLQFAFLILIVIFEILKDAVVNIKNGKSLENTVSHLVAGVIICAFSFYTAIFVSVGMRSWGYIFKDGLAYIPRPVLVAVQVAAIFFGYKFLQKYFRDMGYKHGKKPDGIVFYALVKAFEMLGSFAFYFVAMTLLAIIGRVFGLIGS